MFKLKDFSNGAKFDCVAILNSEFVLENKQKIIDDFTARAERMGCKVSVTPDKIINIDTNQFLLLPKISKRREGILTFRSKDYVFDFDGKTSYGDKPKAADITETGFNLTMFNGDVINYILTKKE